MLSASLALFKSQACGCHHEVWLFLGLRTSGPDPSPPHPGAGPRAIHHSTHLVGRRGGGRAGAGGSSCVLPPSTTTPATSRVQESRDFAQSPSSVGGVVCAMQGGCGGRAAKPRALWGPEEHAGGDYFLFFI